MKLLVLSDLHGRAERAEGVISLHRDAEAVLFLGDGLRELSELCTRMGITPICVRGNCDFFSMLGGADAPEERMLRFGDFKILMTHGHRQGVKHGTDTAIAYAVSRGADLLLYGHTHLAEEQYLPEGTELGGLRLSRPLWVMKPGSLGEPRGGAPSYGLVQIRGSSLLLSHGQV